MTTIEVPCPTCAATGESTHEDRHAGTNMDTCRTCGGRRMIPACPGESRETSWPYAVPGAPQPPSSTPGEVERLVDALDQVYSAAVWLVNSRPPPTGDRISYDDGFGRGVVAAAERIQHEIVSIMPDFHDRVAARTALPSHISTAGRGEGAGDLARLSDLATQGEWRPDVHVYYDEDGGPPEDNTEGVMVLDGDGRPDSIIQCSEDDARFVVALVNAFRSGRLVERSAADATNPQDQE